MKQRRKAKSGEPQTITRAVAHIRLGEANSGKLAALDQLAEEYLRVCQHYVVLFCTTEQPNAFRASCVLTPLSQRWQRAAIQQSAGIAQSWRTNRATAYQEYVDRLAAYHDHLAEEKPETPATEPTWKEWDVPTLRQVCLQANVNVVELERSHDSSFDYWLKISTLAFRQQLLVPVKLAAYHRAALKDKTINTSVVLNKRDGIWWLSLSYDEVIPVQTSPDAPVVGMDVGIANYVTTSTGKHYGSFDTKLKERLKRDREKRRRKAKLRACLEKKGTARENLPSTSSRSGQRLARHVRQSINRAVNLCMDEHQGMRVAYELLSVSTMRHKARAMNAYMRASNLAHIPHKIAWNCLKRGILATKVKSAYSSQECSVCHFISKANRPNQSTFVCVVCHHSDHADHNAAVNLASRVDDTALRACRDRHAIKVLLLQRHQKWKKQNGCS